MISNELLPATGDNYVTLFSAKTASFDTPRTISNLIAVEIEISEFVSIAMLDTRQEDIDHERSGTGLHLLLALSGRPLLRS